MGSFLRGSDRLGGSHKRPPGFAACGGSGFFHLAFVPQIPVAAKAASGGGINDFLVCGILVVHSDYLEDGMGIFAGLCHQGESGKGF